MAILKTFLLSLVLAAAAGFADGWLGVRLTRADRPTIEEVVPDSPAAKAGLRHGDVFLSVNGKATNTAESLVETIRGFDSGTVVKLVIRRGRKKIDVKVRLGTRPVEGRRIVPERVREPEAKRPAKVGKRAPGKAYLGVEIEESENGLVVTDLVAGSPASRSALRRGDRLRTFNGRTVRDIDQLDAIMARVSPKDTVRLGVRRGERTVKIAITAAATPGPRPGVEVRVPAKRIPKRIPKKPTPKKPTPKKVKPAKGADRVRGRQPKKLAPAVVKSPDRSASKGFSTSLPQSLARAKRTGRPLLVVFGASWCVNCQALKKSLQHSSVESSLSRYERVWIDTDQQSALADEYDVESLPHTLFMTSDGKTRKKLIGYQPPQILLPVLRAGLSGGARANRAAADANRAAAAKRAIAAEKAAARKKAAGKAAAKKAAAKKAAKEKAAAKKAAARKAAAKKAAVAKARDRRPDAPRRRGAAARAAAPRRRAAIPNAELQRLRAELQRVRAEQRAQRRLLQQILQELKKKRQ